MGGVSKTKYGCVAHSQFTNAQVLTWPTVNPAPDGGSLLICPGVPGYAILPLYMTFNLSPWFANYTNIDPLAGLDLRINNQSSTEYDVGVGSGPIPAPFISIFLAFGNTHFDGYDVKRGDANIHDLIGFPVVAHMKNGAAGNFTGGHPSNILKVTLFYATISDT